jgi:hypothetical protein
VLSTTVRIAFLRCTHAHTEWALCTSNNGANTATQSVIWLANTCCAVPLHESSRNEPSQNHYFGVQTPSKLTLAIYTCDEHGRELVGSSRNIPEDTKCLSGRCFHWNACGFLQRIAGWTDINNVYVKQWMKWKLMSFDTAVFNSYYGRLLDRIMQGLLTPEIDCEISNNVKLAAFGTVIETTLFASSEMNICTCVRGPQWISKLPFIHEIWLYGHL